MGLFYFTYTCEREGPSHWRASGGITEWSPKLHFMARLGSRSVHEEKPGETHGLVLRLTLPLFHSNPYQGIKLVAMLCS
jgi:hypothetical protein